MVANRLAHTDGVTVGIIEAGGFYELENGNWSQIPAYAQRGIGPSPAQALPLVDWGFVTTLQSVRCRTSISSSASANAG